MQYAIKLSLLSLKQRSSIRISQKTDLAKVADYNIHVKIKFKSN